LDPGYTMKMEPNLSVVISNLASYPGSFGEGEKRVWYLLFVHALNSKVFGFLRVRPCYADVTSQLAALWTLHQRNGSFHVLHSWTTQLCFCDFERWTNSLRQGHLWRKGCISLAAYRFWQVNVLWSTTLRVWWQARKTWQNHWLLNLDKDDTNHVEHQSFTTVCTYIALRYPRTWVC